MANARFKQPPEVYHGGWMSRLYGRTAIAGEMENRYQALTDDLGGVMRLSYAQRSLCERALWLEFWLANMERQLASGGEFEIGKWTQACNSLQGVFAKLGLERKAHDISLTEVIQGKE